MAQKKKKKKGQGMLGRWRTDQKMDEWMKSFALGGSQCCFWNLQAGSLVRQYVIVLAFMLLSFYFVFFSTRLKIYQCEFFFARYGCFALLKRLRVVSCPQNWSTESTL